MYDLRLERSTAKQLAQVPDADHQRLINRIRVLADSPRPHGCRKIRGSHADYRLRVGDWRIIYEVDDKHKVVSVIRIVLRKDAYR